MSLSRITRTITSRNYYNNYVPVATRNFLQIAKISLSYFLKFNILLINIYILLVSSRSANLDKGLRLIIFWTNLMALHINAHYALRHSDLNIYAQGENIADEIDQYDYSVLTEPTHMRKTATTNKLMFLFPQNKKKTNGTNILTV